MLTLCCCMLLVVGVGSTISADFSFSLTWRGKSLFKYLHYAICETIAETQKV